jgi:hypothetical protein
VTFRESGDVLNLSADLGLSSAFFALQDLPNANMTSDDQFFFDYVGDIDIGTFQNPPLC